MRLLIKLRCVEDGPYEMQYHYHLQGFIYRLLEGSKYHYIHDKEGYKFFCFSNVFPAKDLVKNDYRTLIISSPHKEFIDYLSQIFNRSWNKIFKVGKMHFSVENTQILDNELPNDKKYSLITGTPIIVRVNRNTYTKYEIKPRINYDYLYWRTEYPVEMFLSQLEMNLQKKYNNFHNLFSDDNVDDIDRFSNSENAQSTLFNRAIFKKQVSTKIMMKGMEQTVIGTVWEFVFEGWENRELIQFALDAGLGERNSLGFGFVNLINSNDTEY